MTEAASAVHKSAPRALIFFSGLNYDTIISAIPLGKQLNGTIGTSTEGKVAYFDPKKLPYTNRIVLEIHKYDFENTQISCEAFGNALYNAGYSSINTGDAAVKYNFPVLLTEWGFAQNGTYWRDTTYNKCLIEFMGKWKPAGWMQWALGGSYYIRNFRGISPQDDDEAWGLLNHNWTGIRSQVTVDNSLTKMVEATLG
jgi:endoglucanase